MAIEMALSMDTGPLKKILEGVRGRLSMEVAKELYQFGEEVMAQSVLRVPVDTGFLRASGYVRPPATTASGIRVQVGYGASYAWYVHEDLNAFHPNGESKFLESVILEMQPQFPERMAAALQRAVANQ